MSRFRWWLARLIAPDAIMRDEFPGEDGVFVYGVKDGFVWSVRADRFRLKSTSRLGVRKYEPGTSLDYWPSNPPFTRFVGTVAQ